MIHLDGGQEVAAEDGSEPLFEFRAPAEMNEGERPKSFGGKHFLFQGKIRGTRQTEGFFAGGSLPAPAGTGERIGCPRPPARRAAFP